MRQRRRRLLGGRERLRWHRGQQQGLLVQMQGYWQRPVEGETLLVGEW